MIVFDRLFRRKKLPDAGIIYEYKSAKDFRVSYDLSQDEQLGFFQYSDGTKVYSISRQGSYYSIPKKMFDYLMELEFSLGDISSSAWGKCYSDDALLISPDKDGFYPYEADIRTDEVCIQHLIHRCGFSGVDDVFYISGCNDCDFISTDKGILHKGLPICPQCGRFVVFIGECQKDLNKINARLSANIS